MHFSSEQTSNVHNLTLKPSVLNLKKKCFKIALKLQVHSDFLNALYNAQRCFPFIVNIVLTLPVIFILQNIG